MKTIFTHPIKTLRYYLVVISVLIFSNLSFAQPDYNFGTGTLITGSYKAVNSVYRFSAVKSGVDAHVTIKAIVNASIDSVDRNGIGHKEAFQPSIYANANSVGYVEFEIKFVAAGTSTPVVQSVINVTSIDIDGSSPATDPSYVIYEFDEYNFPSGAAMDYNLSGGQLIYSTSGSWVRGKNSGGVEYVDVDTVAKDVMFTMIAQNQSTFLVRMGADNRNNTNSYRLRSLYFKKFVYPSSRLLPVKLSSFNAILEKEVVTLNWETASEINASHFFVERSFDGNDFEDVGMVFAFGNSTTALNYSFTDSRIGSNSIIYYRLRSVDIDGKFEYSNTRIIRNYKQKDNEIKITAFPNPVINELRISIPTNWQHSQIVYEVYSSNGVLVNQVMKSNSSQTETIDFSRNPTGMYYLVVTCNGQVAKQNIIKY